MHMSMSPFDHASIGWQGCAQTAAVVTTSPAISNGSMRACICPSGRNLRTQRAPTGYRPEADHPPGNYPSYARPSFAQWNGMGGRYGVL